MRPVVGGIGAAIRVELRLEILQGRAFVRADLLLRRHVVLELVVDVGRLHLTPRHTGFHRGFGNRHGHCRRHTEIKRARNNLARLKLTVFNQFRNRKGCGNLHLIINA